MLADVPRVIEQIGNAFGFGEDEILKVRYKFLLHIRNVRS